MASQVEICNLALCAIGVKPISSITEASEPARRCNLVWTTEVESVLQENDWSFARRESALAEVSGAEFDGWDYAYAFPSNCVSPRKVYQEGYSSENPPSKFEVMHYPTTNVKVICSNIEDAYLRYTAKVTDPTLFDPVFTEALSYKIASKVAYALTSNRTLADAVEKKYKELISKAKATNKNEGPVHAVVQSDYITSRG